MRRTVVGLFSVVMVAATLWPAAASPPRDSFPLSNYPMFTSDRPTVASFDTVVAVADGGDVDRLSPHVISGTDQVIQAAATVRQAIRAAEADDLCAEIAGRVDAGRTLEVVTETYDTVAWFDGDETPVDRTVHATCPAGP